MSALGGKQTLELTEAGACDDVTRMSYERPRIGNAYWLSVLAGAFVGISLQMIVAMWGERIDASDAWAIPVVILSYGLFAFPFVALGLAVFGLPATALLRPRWQSWWMGLVATICGALAGKLMYYAIDQLFFLGAYDPRQVFLADMGIIYGVPTALAWWLLYRRELARG